MNGFFLANQPFQLPFLRAFRTVWALLRLPIVAEVSVASLLTLALEFNLISFGIFLFAAAFRIYFLPLPLFLQQRPLFYIFRIFLDTRMTLSRNFGDFTI